MAKNIVICCDGTGQNGQVHTNVSRIYSLLDLSDRRKQIGCYDRGVGTVPGPELREAVARHGEPGEETVPGSLWDAPVIRQVYRLAGMAVGAGLFRNVREMYEVLVRCYDEGDPIFLFGFSRGAFTVRVLAGLVHRMGLLRPDRKHLFRQAFALYRPHYEALSSAMEARKRAEVAEFRAAHCRDVPEIAFLGLWDTVKSVGYVRPVSMPHTRRNPTVRRVRHALSIDERRSFFIPTSWGGLDRDSEPPIEGQDVQEIWFAGGHTDVGGGYRREEGGLSLPSLRWILREAVQHGLRVDDARMARVLDPVCTESVAHDELRKLRWRLAEYAPRQELVNDPPPPRRVFRWGPGGRRRLERSARGGVVRVDESAREFYGPVLPWAHVEVVDAGRSLPSDGVRLGEGTKVVSGTGTTAG